MLKITVLLFLVCATCHAGVPVSPLPSPSAQRVLCGYIPEQVFDCVGYPTIFSTDASRSCSRTVKAGSSVCEKVSCTFRNLAFLVGPNLLRNNIAEYFDDFAEKHPVWSPAIQQAKRICLAPELPAQGIFLNCPAYDITMCTLATFLRYAQPSQWATLPQCESAKQYAASCPVCPEECFAAQIPVGSCNACYPSQTP